MYQSIRSIERIYICISGTNIAVKIGDPHVVKEGKRTQKDLSRDCSDFGAYC